MKFKKMEAFGFKSFADKIEVPLNEGITAIVGPNGCGKSNVSDAIRWVLGEQSAKNLRGKSMQDVIFNGTSIRKQLSFCEVSLTFDNTTRIFDIDLDEVVITRKLYRSGESNYLINNTPCRLKDIQALIRDTGLGRDGYSIVGQGRIDEIINAKPENRRNIFEDAAGILTYKKNKIEAEKKLASTDDNIEKIRIAKDSLEGQRNLLERQSRDARKYLETRDRLKVLEANEYVYQFENHESVKVKIRTRLEGFTQELEAKSIEADNNNREYDLKNMELNNIDVMLTKLRDKRTDIAVKAENIRGQGLTMQERVNNLQEQKSQCLQRLTQSEKTLEEKNRELKTLKEQYNMTAEDKKASDKKYAECNNNYIALVNEIVDRDQKIKSANQDLLNALQKEGETKVDISKFTTQREFILTRIAELNSEIDSYDNAIKTYEETKREHEKNLVNMKNDLNRLVISRNEVMSEIRQLQEEQDRARSRASELNADMSVARQRLETNKSLRREYGNFTLRSLMGDAELNRELKSRILGVVSDLVNVPKDYETAIETALGASLQNVVVSNEEDAKYVIAYLRERQYGRLTFLPLTSVKPRELEREFSSILREQGCLGVASKLIKYDSKYDNVFSSLLGRTLIVDNIDNATLIARKYRYAVRIVTLKGDVLSTTGSISGGSQKASSARVLSYERLIAEDEQRLKDYAVEKQKIEKLLSTAEEDLADYQEKNNSGKVTMDNMRRIFSSFFSWLEDEDYIVKSPVRRIHKVKCANMIKETFSDEALEILRDTCTSLRNLAIIELLASAGIRVGELVLLNRQDINFNERSCVVFGKGDKQREVYFDARTKLHLRQYLDLRTDSNEALFVSLKAPFNRLQISGVEKAVRRLGELAEVKKVHPHKFRRTLATMAIDKGMPIEQVQNLLGHKNINTTMQYAMVNTANVKNSHRKIIG